MPFYYKDQMTNNIYVWCKAILEQSTGDQSSSNSNIWQNGVTRLENGTYYSVLCIFVHNTIWTNIVTIDVIKQEFKPLCTRVLKYVLKKISFTEQILQ